MYCVKFWSEFQSNWLESDMEASLISPEIVYTLNQYNNSYWRKLLFQKIGTRTYFIYYFVISVKQTYHQSNIDVNSRVIIHADR